MMMMMIEGKTANETKEKETEDTSRNDEDRKCDGEEKVSADDSMRTYVTTIIAMHNRNLSSGMMTDAHHARP
jgi:hypothetical protein